MQLSFLLMIVLLMWACIVFATDAPSFVPTVAPSLDLSPLPTVVPTTRKPTAPKPTRASTPHIYGSGADPVKLSQNDQQVIVGVLTILLFVFMVMEFLSPEILFLIALVIVMLCEILTLTETLSGFSNESMITIGALFLVVGGVEKSHVVDWMARKTFGTVGSLTVGKFRMYITCFILSIFFNNTPLVAILLPVVKDWGRMRGISASQLLIPLSYSVLSGSFGSMIGTSTNLTVQGLMEEDRGYGFPFFAPLPIGIVCFVVLLFYQIFAGPYLLPDTKSGLIRQARDKTENLIAEVYVSEHSSAVGGTLSTVMNSLGIAPSNAIKIRRCISAINNAKSSDPEKKNKKHDRFSSILDRNYLKRSAQYWFSPNGNKIPDQLSSYAPVTTVGDANNINNNSDITNNNDPETTEGIDNDSNHNSNNNTNTNNNNDEYIDLVAPSPNEIIAVHDVIFISSATSVIEKMMKSIAGESRGLYILKSNVMALPGFGTTVVEVVVSDTNPFLGKTLAEAAPLFADKYKIAVITARGKNWNDDGEDNTDVNRSDFDENSTANGANKEELAALNNSNHDVDEENNVNNTEIGIELSRVYNSNKTNNNIITDNYNNNDNNGDNINENNSLVGSNIFKEDGLSAISKVQQQQSVSNHILVYGDTVLGITDEKEIDKLSHNKDFFVVSSVGALPIPMTFYTAIPVAIFATMLILVATENIDMAPAALTVASVFFIGGWITYDDIPKLIDIRLLMLMGCSLSFAKGMTKTGLALRIAEAINDSDPSNFGALLLVYALTLAITELISNNAAAALMYPIAVALADQLGVSFKPFAMAVLIASTAGFMSPIGYQTHVMVWGPGGYRFKDFLIFGFIPDVIYWLLGCVIIIATFPF